MITCAQFSRRCTPDAWLPSPTQVPPASSSPLSSLRPPGLATEGDDGFLSLKKFPTVCIKLFFDNSINLMQLLPLAHMLLPTPAYHREGLCM